MILVGALWLVASSDGGSRRERLPLHAQVQRESSTSLRLGVGRITTFSWAMWAELSPSRDHVCVDTVLAGPIYHFPNGSSGDPGEGNRYMCGPIKTTRSIKAVLPEKASSITQPSGETESWQSFDVGVVAYPPSIGQVRLSFSDGTSEVIKARAVPSRLAFKGAEPFHYALFAVHGCVSKVQGLARGRVMVSTDERGCSDSSE